MNYQELEFDDDYISPDIPDEYPEGDWCVENRSPWS